MQLFDIFERTVASQPNKPAFIYFSEQTKKWDVFTYQQFADSTHRFLLGLSACSLTPNMTAAVMTPPSIEFFPFAFALLKFGIIPIILDPAVGLKKVSDILKESKPDIFIGNTTTHFLRTIFGWGRNSIKHNLSIESVKSQNSKVAQLPFTNYQLPSTSPAAIIYTSGSTGLPKGAIYTQENLAAQLELLKNTFQISHDEIDLPAFPLYALIDVLLGVTSVIPDVTFPVPAKTDAAKVLAAIQKFNVTNMFASPVVLEIFSSFALSGAAAVWRRSRRAGQRFDYGAKNAPPLNANLPSLKRIITAGAPATIDLQKRFRNLLEDHTGLFGIYGATETLPIAKIESREVFALQEKTQNGAGICLGKPIEGVTVRIIGISESAILEWHDDLTVKPNVVGEITVQSAATTRSYIQREDANQLSKIPRHTCTGVRRKCCESDSQKQSPTQSEGLLRREKIPPPNDEETDIIHRMGDVGYFDEEGRLWYCGRKSHRVITEDEVLFTVQIEHIFNAHPQVNRTALVGVNGEPVLWVEMKKGARENRDTIKRELLEIAKPHLQASKIKVFLFMKKFPTDVRHNSKIIREQLAKQAARALRPSTFDLRRFFLP